MVKILPGQIELILNTFLEEERKGEIKLINDQGACLLNHSYANVKKEENFYHSFGV